MKGLRAPHLYCLLLACAVSCASAAPGSGPPPAGSSAERDDGYRTPPAAVERLLTALRPPEPMLHVGSGRVALLYREQALPLERLARPFLGLAGFRYDPTTRMTGIARLVVRVEVLALDANADSPMPVWQPADGALLEHVHFSPDGHHLSALVVGDGPAQLAIFDIERGKARRLSVPVQPAWGSPCDWISADALLCRVIPDPARPAPPGHAAPVLLEHTGRPTPMRTYSNLLHSTTDDALFEHHFASELARVEIHGPVTRIPGTRGLLESVEASPDGSFAVVSRLQPPYPRLVRASRFPSVVEIWDLEAGECLHTSLPVGFGVDRDDVRDGPRRFVWAPGSPTTLGWIERTEDRDGRRAYRWMVHEEPVAGSGREGSARELAVSKRPIKRFGWTTAGTAYFTTRTDDRKGIQLHVVTEGETREIWSGATNDRYDDPGHPLRVAGNEGPVLEIDGRIFLAGDGLGPGGPQPFLDAFDLGSGRTERLFTSDEGVFETVLGILDPATPVLLTSRETTVEPPTLHVHAGASRRVLHSAPTPYPDLEGVERRAISYRRADGLALSGTLYLPADREPGVPLPTLIWIYPREYDDVERAEQLDVRAFRFHRVRGVSPLAAVLEGYAVLVYPTVPILRVGEHPNDDYIAQLVGSVEAAADHLVATGVSERGRIAVGGHSYGAFSAANLVAHSDAFATAIAMSGAYNRTLTPFGFQHEKRDLWEATELYTSISPFFRVDRIEEPVLLIHGGADPNAGTPPLQSRRFFHAMAGEGVTSRYVELPYEEHHYRARRNVLHAAAEVLDWLDHTIGAASRQAHAP